MVVTNALHTTLGRMAPASPKYLDSKESQQEMFSRLDPVTKAEWDSYGHLRIEGAFQDRVFVVYEDTGRNNSGAWRAPKIITTVRVMSFRATDEDGCCVRLLNESCNETMDVGHLPKKVFGYPVFVAIPVSFALRWDVHEHGGKMRRSLAYPLFVKARNRAEFHSKGNTYLESPNKMREELFPRLDLKFDL